MHKDGGPGPTNPMLYDERPEGTVETKKLMQFVCVSAVSFAAISGGTALAWTSPFESQVNEGTEISVTSEQKSWVGAFIAVGAFIGALPAGMLAERIGRRWTSISIGIPYLLGWLTIATAGSVPMLYTGRVLIGIATGASCVVAPMFISEIAETSLRGALGACFQLFLTIGILFIYVGAFIDWVTLTWIIMIFPILLMVTVFFIPDSPIYLVKKGARQEAAAALKKFWGRQCDAQQALANIQADLDAMAGDAKISDLFTVRANLVALIISLSLMFFQQFSGINAVIFYTEGIFKSAGSTLQPKLCAIIVGVVQVLMTFASALLIEKAGRRILLLQSSVIMGICLALLGVYFTLVPETVKDQTILETTTVKNATFVEMTTVLSATISDMTTVKPPDDGVMYLSYLPLASVVMFIVSFSLGFGPIPWMMMGELFAPDVKGIASAIAVMFNWTLVFIIAKTFGTMKEAWGSGPTFYFFAAFMVLGTIFVFFAVPETKGKTNAQIQAILAGKR